jgi:hypothetical protein
MKNHLQDLERLPLTTSWINSHLATFLIGSGHPRAGREEEFRLKIFFVTIFFGSVFLFNFSSELLPGPAPENR